LPIGIRGLAYGILFAASATTLTGVWSALSAMVIGDFFGVNETKKCARVRLLTISFAGLSFFLAHFLVDKIFNKLILANIPIAALSFALLAGFYWKKASRVGAYSSIFVGWACGIGAYLYWGEEGGYTWYWALLGIPALFFTGIIGSLFFPDKRKEEFQTVSH